MVLLQAAGFDPSLLLMVGMFAVMYFFFIRPQQKKQKAQAAFQDELTRGMEIVTGSGIIGKISNIDTNVVTISTDGKGSIKMLKSAISKEMTEMYQKPNGAVIEKQ